VPPENVTVSLPSIAMPLKVRIRYAPSAAKVNNRLGIMSKQVSAWVSRTLGIPATPRTTRRTKRAASQEIVYLPVGTENSVRADSTGLKARVVPPLPVVGNPRLQAGFDRRFLDDQATRKRGFSSDSLDRRGTASRSICVAEKAAAGLFAALEERHTQ
jgi:hypothetical protein